MYIYTMSCVYIYAECEINTQSDVQHFFHRCPCEGNLQDDGCTTMTNTFPLYNKIRKQQCLGGRCQLEWDTDDSQIQLRNNAAECQIKLKDN